MLPNYRFLLFVCFHYLRHIVDVVSWGIRVEIEVAELLVLRYLGDESSKWRALLALFLLFEFNGSLFNLPKLLLSPSEILLPSSRLILSDSRFPISPLTVLPIPPLTLLPLPGRSLPPLTLLPDMSLPLIPIAGRFLGFLCNNQLSLDTNQLRSKKERNKAHPGFSLSAQLLLLSAAVFLGSAFFTDAVGPWLAA